MLIQIKVKAKQVEDMKKKKRIGQEEEPLIIQFGSIIVYNRKTCQSYLILHRHIFSIIGFPL